MPDVRKVTCAELLFGIVTTRLRAKHTYMFSIVATYKHNKCVQLAVYGLCPVSQLHLRGIC